MKFEFKRDGISREGFAVLAEGKIVAYENVCRHLPVSLDYGDGRFFTRDRRYLICQTHGALYEPATGLCVRGPCLGASLKPLQVEIRDETVCLILEAEE